MKEKGRDKNKNWEKIGKLKNGYGVIYNMETERINVKESLNYAREPYREEWKEIFEIIQKKYRRWQIVLELIKRQIIENF